MDRTIRTFAAIATAIAFCFQPASGEILWQADHEERDLSDWTFPDFRYSGGGIFNTGNNREARARATSEVAHSGRYSAEASIMRADGEAFAVRLMRSTDRPWDDDGEYFPREAYYSTWMYFAHEYTPDEWWNVFQFKSKDRRGTSQPTWSVNVGHNDAGMYFRLYTKINGRQGFMQPEPLVVPAKKWIHLEAFFRQGESKNGRITVWQDGKEIFDFMKVNTKLEGNNTWGIGNYTDGISGHDKGRGYATIYFDDCVVSTERIGTDTDPPPSDDTPEIGDLLDKMERQIRGFQRTVDEIRERVDE